MSTAEERTPLIGSTRPPNSRFNDACINSPHTGHQSEDHSTPSCSSGNNDSPPGGTRGHLGLVSLLLIILLQMFGTNIEVASKHTLAEFFMISIDEVKHKFMPFVVVLSVILYFLPMIVGLYADTLAGRYETLFFGLGLKLSGSLLGFITVFVFEYFGNFDEAVVKALFSIYMVSCVFILIGYIILGPTVITFAAQQVEPSFYGISSMMRWSLWMVAIGLPVSSILPNLDRKDHTILDPTSHYFKSVLYAVQLGCDVLSIVVLLLGKVRYNIMTTEDGQKSWKEFLRIIKTHILCSKSPEMQDDAIFRSRQRQQQLRNLDRLKIRKAVLFVGLLSCFAVFLAMTFVQEQLLTIFKHRWGGDFLLYAVRQCKYIPFILGAPIVEILFKRYGRYLKPETTANQLKTVAVASVCGTVSLVIAGVVNMLLRDDGEGSVYWFVPPNIVMGLASFFIYTTALTLCYLVSPRGLETFVMCCAACLCVLLFVLEAILATATDLRAFDHLDILCYALAGIMVLVLLVVYRPLSRWYLDAEKAIEDFVEQDGGGPTQMLRVTPASPEHSLQNPDVVANNSVDTVSEVSTSCSAGEIDD